MSIKEFYEAIKGLGMPCAYHHFDEGKAPKLPYLLYLLPESENFAADNYAYHKATKVQLELYTSKKDLTSEKQVETLLDEHRLFFDKVEVFVDTEKLYQTTYHFSL